MAETSTAPKTRTAMDKPANGGAQPEATASPKVKKPRTVIPVDAETKCQIQVERLFSKHGLNAAARSRVIDALARKFTEQKASAPAAS
jgi:hypothetical protein